MEAVHSGEYRVITLPSTATALHQVWLGPFRTLQPILGRLLPEQDGNQFSNDKAGAARTLRTRHMQQTLHGLVLECLQYDRLAERRSRRRDRLPALHRTRTDRLVGPLTVFAATRLGKNQTG